jgi:hypothetical protein
MQRQNLKFSRAYANALWIRFTDRNADKVKYRWLVPFWNLRPLSWPLMRGFNASTSKLVSAVLGQFSLSTSYKLNSLSDLQQILFPSRKTRPGVPRDSKFSCSYAFLWLASFLGYIYWYKRWLLVYRTLYELQSIQLSIKTEFLVVCCNNFQVHKMNT